MYKLHHCVDEVSEKGAKHVEHKSSVSKLVDDSTADALVALRKKLEGKK